MIRKTIREAVMNYFEIIDNRKSIRDFKEDPVENKKAIPLLEYYSKARCLNPSIRTEATIAIGENAAKLKGRVGYQGISFNAPAYFILFSEKKEGYLENAGYLTEDMILTLTDAGLDSCWLTVTDEKFLIDNFKKDICLDGDYTAVSVIAFGYGVEEPDKTYLHIVTPSEITVTEREGHLAPKISLEEMVFEKNWSVPADLSEDYVDEGLLNAFYAVSYAPSFLNRQPTRLIYDQDTGKVLLVRLPDPIITANDARLGSGAAMLNFALALSDRRPKEEKWTPGKPETAYKIPEGAEIIAYFTV